MVGIIIAAITLDRVPSPVKGKKQKKDIKQTYKTIEHGSYETHKRFQVLQTLKGYAVNNALRKPVSVRSS